MTIASIIGGITGAAGAKRIRDTHKRINDRRERLKADPEFQKLSSEDKLKILEKADD